ncbi:exosome complex protein Rrp42 [Candidatus Woesearchaeota archaeon]|nr:exosome complex protein Rrp42 [Candidatus Woesearchaeota archaeon]
MQNTTIKQHLMKAFQQNMRLDGRGLEEFRKIEVELDISKTAEGSARVKIGDTEVLAGVKMIISNPFPDTPEDGAIMINAEFLPMASARFESGPPGIESIELARIVDRGLRESKAIDVKKLCIKKGEKVWAVSVDIITMNDDGNLLDAAALATILAVKHTRYPSFDGIEVDYKELTDTPLEITKIPITVTVCKTGSYIFVDPVSEEESNIDARLTVTTMQDGNICALQKGGSMPLSLKDISTMVDLAAKKAEELRELVK